MKKFLNIGCGPKREKNYSEMFKGWQEIRVDLNPSVSPDVCASITNLEAIAPSSVQGIFTSHTLEHISFHEIAKTLAGFFRVLSEDGIAIITVPDLGAVMRKICETKDLELDLYTSPLGPITALDCIYGYSKDIEGGNDFMLHKTGFTALTLGRALTKAGFMDVRIYEGPWELWGIAHKSANSTIPQ